MDLMNRGNRPTQPAHPVPSSPSPSNLGGSGREHKKGFTAYKGLKIASTVLLFSIGILVVAVLSYIVLARPASESKFVDDERLQAVFLNGGQVYFGNIREINDKYVRLGNIFYLRVNQQVQPKQGEQAQNDISLVKLGCELHRPTNEMLITREQVVFWENLKDDDAQNTVPGAVKEYLKQYPNGQECQDANQQTKSNTNTNKQTDTQSETNNEDTTPSTNTGQ